jgi:hypothetical protein
VRFTTGFEQCGPWVRRIGMSRVLTPGAPLVVPHEEDEARVATTAGSSAIARAVIAAAPLELHGAGDSTSVSRSRTRVRGTVVVRNLQSYTRSGSRGPL